MKQVILYSSILMLLFLSSCENENINHMMIKASSANKSIDVSATKLRGVWVATIYNIDIDKQIGTDSRAIEIYKEQYIQILETLKQFHMNAIFFQVRPSSDAFYQSELNPWSRYLTGEEGADPGWDPLSWMIEMTHEYNMLFYAWLNPYRVTNSTNLSKDEYLKTLNPSNFAYKNKNLVFSVTMSNGCNELSLNPGEKRVQEFIKDTVMEVVNNYNVDGICFDDYFYPEVDIKSLDYSTYLNTNSILSIEDWRRQNIDSVIKEVNLTISNYNVLNHKSVQFGVSPSGIWANQDENNLGSNTNGEQSYYDDYADSRKWVKEEWVDFIIPQVYWSFDNSYAPYADVVKWWDQVVKDTDVKLYIGQGMYQYADNVGWQNPNEIPNHLLFDDQYKEIVGSVFFSYNQFTRKDNVVLTEGREDLQNLLFQDINS